MAKILLAEDDATMVSLLKTLLKMEGYEVLALDADTDILAAVEREKPHALFMDVHLGDQSGMKVLESIRKNRETGVFEPVSEGRWRTNLLRYSTAASDVPNGLMGVFQARLDDLPYLARRVVQMTPVRFGSLTILEE